jgi:hypothetical protein
MQLSARVITKPEGLTEIEDELAVFVSCNSENPFLLPSFVKTAMCLFPSPNQVPIVLIVRCDDEIIGYCPMQLNRTRFGMHAQPLLGLIAPTSFVLRDTRSQLALELMIRLLFKKLNCKRVHFWSNNQWKHKASLVNACKSSKIILFERPDPEMNHCVIPVNCSWSDYQKVRGKEFRRTLRRISLRLDALGKWDVVSFDVSNSENKNSLHEKIFAVEKQSWKESYRTLVSVPFDNTLAWVLETSPIALEKDLGVKQWVYFLEVNHQPVAYQIGYDFHGTTFFIKTSFNERYRKLGLGKFITTMAIKDVFESKSGGLIDLFSNLPVFDFWNASCLERSRLTLNASGMNSLLVNTKIIVGAAYRHFKPENKRSVYYKPTALVQMVEAKKQSSISTH